jgi:hypothetical protein
MTNRTVTLLLLLLACPLAGLAVSQPQPLPPMTAEAWRADLDFFARELPRRHKNAFHTITREQLAAEVASLRARAGQANDDEMIVGLMRIAAMVGDGHTYVHLPSSLHQLPITVASIEGAYRVVRGAGAAAELVGGKPRYYKFLPQDGLVTPDKEILPTWAGWVAGRDPVLDWIVEQ